jgi:hypothetical protein
LVAPSLQKRNEPLPVAHGTLAWHAPVPPVVPPPTAHQVPTVAIAAAQSPHEVQKNRSPLDARK